MTNSAVLAEVALLYDAARVSSVAWPDRGDNGLDLSNMGSTPVLRGGGLTSPCPAIPECGNSVRDFVPFAWVDETAVDCGGACLTCGCDASPCNNGGVCSNVPYPGGSNPDYTCDCSGVDYSGDQVSCCGVLRLCPGLAPADVRPSCAVTCALQCDDLIDDCLGVTCANGGTCVDGVRSFTCTCAAGWEGAWCCATRARCRRDEAG